jgi:uncharacterized protein YllA (UPF0747 family)
MTTAFVKLLAFSSKGDKEYLDDFLKKHELNLDAKYYQEMDNCVNSMYSVLNNKNKDDMTMEEIKPIVYTFIASAIEKTFSNYNISLEKPMSWTKRKMKPHKKEASDFLEIKFKESLEEINDVIKEIKQNLESTENPEKVDDTDAT